MRKLHVFVVDNHDEALERLHLALRRKWLPLAGVAMVHLDAHADMSVPRSLDAAKLVCRGAAAPSRALYAHLADAPGGISEWILPACYAGHVGVVWWVRPAWLDARDDGIADDEARCMRYVRSFTRLPYVIVAHTHTWGSPSVQTCDDVPDSTRSTWARSPRRRPSAPPRTTTRRPRRATPPPRPPGRPSRRRPRSAGCA